MFLIVLLQLNHIQDTTIQGFADTNQRFHADILALLMLAIKFVVDRRHASPLS